MTTGTMPVPPPHIEDSPTVQVCINQEWAAVLIGQIWPLRYPEAWGGTLEENRRARGEIKNLIDMLMSTGECEMTTCCLPPTIINRVNVTTGAVEISIDNGATWTPSPNTVQSVIVQPPPPVTSGVASNKCDAATNVMTQIEDWIEHVGTAFDVAAGLLDFAILVASAILDAILLLLSEGALTAAEAQIITIITGVLTAVWEGGKALFTDYWTSEEKDKILCAAVCSIGDDGSFSDAAFAAFYGKCSSELTGGLAKTLFLGFISSVGVAGLNSMAASGKSADSDCSDCICSDFLRVYVSSGGGTEISWDGQNLIAEPVADGDHYTLFVQVQPNGTFDASICGYMSYEVLSGTVDGSNDDFQPCGTTSNLQPTGIQPLCSRNANQVAIRGPVPFQVRFVGTPVASC